MAYHGHNDFYSVSSLFGSAFLVLFMASQNLFDVLNRRVEDKARPGGITKKNRFLEPRVFSVSEFYNYVNELLGLEEVIVEGEISELRVAKGYLVYFSVNDKESVLPCLAFKNKLESIGISVDALEVGSTVRVIGVPNVYAKRGGFTFVVNRVTLVGEGALKRAFELLKRKLMQEGLFDERLKRQIPRYPEHIGLITSKGAAAYSDFIKVLQVRWGGMKIYFYPVSVQGETAIEEIISAFSYFNTHVPLLDLLVLTRGGGSLEDLAAFNSETIARAVRASKWPVVCAIGHERDESLAEYAADLRASTPSNAAELLVPTREEERGYLHSLERKIVLHVEKKLANEKQFFERSLLKMEQFFQHPKTELLSVKEHLQRSVAVWITRMKNDLHQGLKLLESYDPKAVLKRGYSITLSKKGRVIKSIGDIVVGEYVATSLHDGLFHSKVTDK